MRLAIISDCVHVQTPQGLAGSDVHIFVRQMDALSKYFSEVHICCPFVSYNATTPITTYTKTHISFIPLKKVGGNGWKDKIQLLLQIPLWFKAFKKAHQLSDIVYQRFPNNLNIPGFFYFYFLRKKVFATYTGTWEKNNQESTTYTFQKWLLQHFFRGPIGVYSTNTNLGKSIFNSFSPSYSEAEWNEETTQVEHKIQQLQNQKNVPLTMVTVGSFIGYKNQQYILDTCLALYQQNIYFHLYMVGDGELMQQYKNFVHQNNLQQHITFTGKLNYNDVRNIYRKVNFVVQAPTVEGFGKVPIEGYFHGALPIINNISMSAYITQQNTLGYLFSVNEKDALLTVLKAVTTQPNEVIQRIQQSRLFVQQFTLEAWAAQYYQQIQQYYPNFFSMRIALINDRLNAGGAEKMLVYIANLLHKNGIDVQVIILLDKAALDHQIHPNIPVHYLNRTSRFSFKAFFCLKKLLQQVDIVHVHSRYNLRYYMVAKYFVNIAKPKIFFHEHVPSYSIDAFTKFLFSKVDAYVAVQNDMRKWAVTNKMVTNQHAFYLANTVDAPKSPIQYKNNQYKILMVGNYRPQKNHLFAVSLLAKLPNQYTIDIYGMIDDEVYYNNLQNHIHTLGLTNRVALVQGVSNLYEKMGNYSFALHTSIAETGPLVLVEYLYAGLPFITYNTGDVVTVIKKKLPNFIVNSFNEAEWLKAIEQLQQKMPEHNFNNVMSEIVQENFSEANYFTQLLHIYNKIMLSK